MHEVDRRNFRNYKPINCYICGNSAAISYIGYMTFIFATSAERQPVTIALSFRERSNRIATADFFSAVLYFFISYTYSDANGTCTYDVITALYTDSIATTLLSLLTSDQPVRAHTASATTMSQSNNDVQ